MDAAERAAAREDIAQLLRAPAQRLGFGGEREQRYRAAHDRRAEAQLRSNLVYLLLLYLVIAVIGFLRVPAAEESLWLQLFSVYGLLLGSAGLVVRRPRVPGVYQKAVSLLAGLAVLSSVLLTLTLSPGQFRQLSCLWGAYVTVVVYLGLSLRVPWAMAAGWCGSLPALLVGWLLGVELEWDLAVGSFLGTNLLCTYLAWHGERQQRQLFLHGELLRLDQSRSEALAAELQRLALVDGLTGLANRRQFDLALKREWRRAAREGTPVALLFTDLDYFKAYNDHLGHQKGDDCLRALARILQAQARRATDVAGRYGGEEFVLMFPGLDLAQARDRARALQQSLQQAALPHPASPCGPWVTVSVGVAAMVPQPGQSPELLVQRADRALYQAKAAGRNRVGVAEPGSPVMEPGVDPSA